MKKTFSLDGVPLEEGHVYYYAGIFPVALLAICPGEYEDRDCLVRYDEEEVLLSLSNLCLRVRRIK